MFQEKEEEEISRRRVKKANVIENVFLFRARKIDQRNITKSPATCIWNIWFSIHKKPATRNHNNQKYRLRWHPLWPAKQAWWGLGGYLAGQSPTDLPASWPYSQSGSPSQSAQGPSPQPALPQITTHTTIGDWAGWPTPMAPPPASDPQSDSSHLSGVGHVAYHPLPLPPANLALIGP